MQRVKNVEYDEDDLYDDGDEEYGNEPGESYTDEDRGNFASLTPVVRAELEEAGLQASDREIEDALWNYYWDVAKSVTYLKKSKTQKQTPGQAEKKQAKPKSKFDQAAERSAKDAGDSIMLPVLSNWFRDVSWSLPPENTASLVPATPVLRPRLLGGSSKLAKLAEERRKKAAAAAVEGTSASTGPFSSLDRLSKPRDAKENEAPAAISEPRKYPIRKKREPTPPPREPTPPPPVPKEQKPDIRALPTAFGQTLSCSPSHGHTAASMPIDKLLGTRTNEDAFKGPSPDDTVFRAQQHSKGATKAKPISDGLVQKTEALKLDQTAAQAPPQPKVRSKDLDVVKLWEEEKSRRKPSAAFVVIGHVDHGKSTLMGRLLLDTRAVSQRDIDKYQKQAAEIGKSSFALAWVMDTGTEERERGVTFDFAQHHFSTDKVDFTILDAPGHRDFVPNMIGGASMADLAVLVVDANQLESGMKGQTREHIQLAKAVGLRKVVVAVNKLDSTTPTWSVEAFDAVRTEISKFLKESEFTDEDVRFVPCSGLSGDNVVNTPSQNNAAWVGSKYTTLLQALETSLPSETTMDAIKHPLRMQIVDVFRGSITNPLSISGRLSSGTVQVGDMVTMQPSGETATIRAVEVFDNARDYAVAGQICTLHLTDIDAQHIRTGDTLCDSSRPVAVGKSFTALLEVLDPLLPQPIDVHVGRLHVPGTIMQLVETVDKRGEQLKRKPRMLKAGQKARVKVRFEDDMGVPLDMGERVVLRSKGVTAAYGRVEQVS